MLTQIKFGMSGGRRAVTAEEFTFAHLRRAVGTIVTGGEQSAGLSIRHHVPEKDAVLARLRCREAVARPGKSLREPLRAISDQVGSYCPKWGNFRLTSEVKPTFTEKLRQDAKEFCGRGERGRPHGWVEACFPRRWWVCYRRSGQEPVVRGDSEAGGEAGLEKLSGAAKHWIFE